jgi:hypothetical protein
MNYITKIWEIGILLVCCDSFNSVNFLVQQYIVHFATYHSTTNGKFKKLFL